MSRKGLNITLEQAQAHQAKHGFIPAVATLRDNFRKMDGEPGGQGQPHATLPKPVKMTRPEKEYGMILEAMKRRGNEIIDYRFQGMSLAWGEDPETHRLMRYKCDFWVWLDPFHNDVVVTKQRLPIKIIEVKGAKIWDRDLVRFKGCRAEWPMFQFEMHQLVKGVWTRIQ